MTQLNDYFLYLREGTGNAVDMSKYEGMSNSTDELKSCLVAFMAFLSCPTYLPYSASVDAYFHQFL